MIYYLLISKLLCHVFTTARLPNLIIFKPAYFRKIPKNEALIFIPLEGGIVIFIKMKSEAGKW
jgi:hypothetical protein